MATPEKNAQDQPLAFPAMELRTHDTGDIVSNASQGMTLRDYFAVRAPEIPDWYERTGNAEMDFFEWRWYYADMMVKGR